jgi:hypothetical protein
MSAIDDLIAVARAYAEAEDIDLSRVSWRALGDTKKLDAIVGGRDIQVRRFEKTMQWFADNWPANAVWPADVGRPSPSHVPDQQDDGGQDGVEQHPAGKAPVHEVTS